MAYLFYMITLLVLASGTALYFLRAHWLPAFQNAFKRIRLPGHDYTYAQLPIGHSFADDAEAGLHSADFDLSGNLTSGDSRAGLDDKAKGEILKIMKNRQLQFDEARRVYMERRFQVNGISADGVPRDPKFVSFS